MYPCCQSFFFFLPHNRENVALNSIFLTFLSCLVHLTYMLMESSILALPNAANSYASMPIKHVTYLEVIGADYPTGRSILQPNCPSRLVFISTAWQLKNPKIGLMEEGVGVPKRLRTVLRYVPADQPQAVWQGFISRGRCPSPFFPAALIEFTPGSGDEMGGKHMPLSSHTQQAISSLPAGSGL